MAADNTISRHPRQPRKRARTTPAEIAPIRPLLFFPLAMVLGYFLSEFFADKDVQDALQYRENLETGVYLREETQGYFGLLVVTLQDLFPGLDPFVVIGTLVAGLFIYCAMVMRPHWSVAVAFTVILVMPMMYFNYTQVLRQGLAVAVLCFALVQRAGPARIIGLIIAGLIHRTYLPLSLLIIARTMAFKVLPPRERLQKDFDIAVFVALAVFWIGFGFFSTEYLDEDVMTRYFRVDVNNTKRVLASVLLWFFVYLIHPTSRHPLVSAMSYAVVSVGLILPFALDFLRLHTYVMPLMTLSALMCESRKRALLALGVCFILSAYVAPIFGIYKVL